MKTKKLLIIILFSLVIMTYIISENTNLDINFYESLILYESALLTNYFIIITKLGNFLTIAILCILLLIIFKNKQIVLLILLSLLTRIINLIIKYIIRRPRPTNINKIVETGYSFPSGHAMISVVFYGLLLLFINESNFSKKYKLVFNVLLIIIIVSICLSRVYLGVHYISDIIAGVLISLIILVIVKEKIWEKF